MRIIDNLKGRLNWQIVFIAIIFIVSCLVYLNTLGNGFVFSDHNQVENNLWIRSVGNIPKIVSSSVWAFKDNFRGNYYRPMMMLSYLFGYHLFGLKAWGFHLIGILLHACNAVLVFLIVNRLIANLPSRLPHDKSTNSPITHHSSLITSLVIALLFATHPINAEAVNWIGCYPDVLFSFFCLLSFWLYLGVLGAAGRTGASSVVGVVHAVPLPLCAGSLFCYFLALLSKETALAFPLLLIAHELTVSSPPTVGGLRGIDSKARGKRVADSETLNLIRMASKRILPYIIVALISLGLRFLVLKGFDFPKFSPDLNIVEQILNIFWLFTQYLGKLILPIKLNIYHIYYLLNGFTDIRLYLALLTVAGYCTLLWWSWRANRFVFIGLAWIVIFLIPVLKIPDFGQDIMAERYAYFSSVGFAMVLGGLFWSGVPRLYAWLTRFVGARRAVFLLVAFATIVICLYAFTTFQRNKVWLNDATLWQDSIHNSAQGFIPNNSLGVVYMKNGQLDKALNYFRKALAIQPKFYSALMNVGDVYRRKHNFDKALEYYQRAQQIEPRRAEAFYEIALLFTQQGQLDFAIANFQHALARRFDYPDCNYNLGLLYANKQDFFQAIKYFKLELQNNPKDPKSNYNLALAYQSVGQNEAAIPLYKLVITLNPRNPSAYNNLGNIYLQKRKFGEAISLFESALRIDPNNPRVYNNLGIAYGENGDLEKARSMFVEALSLNPDYQQAKLNLERVRGGSD